MTAPHTAITGEASEQQPVTIFGPDFPFAYDDWLAHPEGLGQVPQARHGSEVAIVGAGMAGMVAAFELMKMGLKPVIYESRRLGGRLHSEPFKGAEGVIAELGGMRFPRSSTAFYHYLDSYRLQTRPFPNPLSAAASSTVVDLEGQPLYVENSDQLSPLLKEVGAAWHEALETDASFSPMQDAIRRRDLDAIKRIWNALIPTWDDRTFYGFIANSEAFMKRSFKHLEAFGQVGFGTGGWDTDFPNSMLEILRVVYTNCDDDQHFVLGGVEQVPRRMWKDKPSAMAHWPDGTSLNSLHHGAPRTGAAKIARNGAGNIEITDTWGDRREYECALVTCQSWLLTTAHRLRRIAVFAEAVDGARSHALHAVVEDLCHGRSSFLERQGPGDRARRDEHDADRPPHARHLSVRPRRRSTGRDLPVLRLDERRAEDAAAAGGKARQAGARRAAENLPDARYPQAHHR